MTAPVLELDKGVVGYEGRAVLPGISLTITPGTVVTVLGANGSGKSTLIKAVVGLLPLTGGTLRLFGTPAAKFRRRERIGYVPQRIGAGSGVPATVREVVGSGRLARRSWRSRDRVHRVAVTRAIDTVGLGDRGDQPVTTLSGGQQQRVLIARALASEPDLLVLDEPTAGVDTPSQIAFASAVRTFVADGGAVLLAAHELGPLEPLVDRAVVLHHGQVVHDGAVPRVAEHHTAPYYEHVHPHARPQPPAMWDGEGGQMP